MQLATQQPEGQQTSGHAEDARTTPSQQVAASVTELSSDESLSSTGDENYLELETEVRKIRQELVQLCKQVNNICAVKSKPTNEAETLRAENLALRSKLKDTEDERDSLRLVISILAKELPGSNSNIVNSQVSVNNQAVNSRFQPSADVGNQDFAQVSNNRKKRNKKKASKETINSNEQTTNKSNQSSLNRLPPNVQNQDGTNTRTTVVIGDSIIKNLQGPSLGREVV